MKCTEKGNTDFDTLTIFGVQAGSHIQDVAIDQPSNKSGRNTLQFKNGVLLWDTKSINSNFLMFSYHSESTGKLCQAVFNKANISGYSWS